MKVLSSFASSLAENVVSDLNRYIFDINPEIFEKSDAVSVGLHIQNVIKRASLLSSAGSLFPLPFSDIVIQTPLHISLVVGIGHLMGIPTVFSQRHNVWSDFSTILGWKFLKRYAQITMLKIGAPFLGGIYTLPMSYAWTYALGQTACSYFELKKIGKPISKQQQKDLQNFFDKSLEKATKLAEEKGIQQILKNNEFKVSHLDITNEKLNNKNLIEKIDYIENAIEEKSNILDQKQIGDSKNNVKATLNDDRNQNDSKNATNNATNNAVNIANINASRDSRDTRVHLQVLSSKKNDGESNNLKLNGQDNFKKINNHKKEDVTTDQKPKDHSKDNTRSDKHQKRSFNSSPPANFQHPTASVSTTILPKNIPTTLDVLESIDYKGNVEPNQVLEDNTKLFANKKEPVVNNAASDISTVKSNTGEYISSEDAYNKNDASIKEKNSIEKTFSIDDAIDKKKDNGFFAEVSSVVQKNNLLRNNQNTTENSALAKPEIPKWVKEKEDSIAKLNALFGNTSKTDSSGKVDNSNKTDVAVSIPSEPAIQPVIERQIKELEIKNDSKKEIADDIADRNESHQDLSTSKNSDKNYDRSYNRGDRKGKQFNPPWSQTRQNENNAVKNGTTNNHNIKNNHSKQYESSLINNKHNLNNIYLENKTSKNDDLLTEFDIIESIIEDAGASHIENKISLDLNSKENIQKIEMKSENKKEIFGGLPKENIVETIVEKVIHKTENLNAIKEENQSRIAQTTLNNNDLLYSLESRRLGGTANTSSLEERRAALALLQQKNSEPKTIKPARDEFKSGEEKKSLNNDLHHKSINQSNFSENIESINTIPEERPDKNKKNEPELSHQLTQNVVEIIEHSNKIEEAVIVEDANHLKNSTKDDIIVPAEKRIPENLIFFDGVESLNPAESVGTEVKHTDNSLSSSSSTSKVYSKNSQAQSNNKKAQNKKPSKDNHFSEEKQNLLESRTEPLFLIEQLPNNKAVINEANMETKEISNSSKPILEGAVNSLADLSMEGSNSNKATSQNDVYTISSKEGLSKNAKRKINRLRAKDAKESKEQELPKKESIMAENQVVSDILAIKSNESEKSINKSKITKKNTKKTSPKINTQLDE